MPKLIDLTGQRFGRLTVLERADNSPAGKIRWLCLCDCGQKAIIHGATLKNGDTRSCGCLNVEKSTQRIIEYQNVNGADGRSKTRLYRIWVSMRNRCNNPNNYDYPNYGGRGVRVCDDWNLSFNSFQEWALNHGYADDLSIDRLDNGGDYTPENCRWTTMKEQHRNQRVSRRLTFGGRTQTLIDWSEETGISHNVLSARLRSGWSTEKTLTTPVEKRTKRK